MPTDEELVRRLETMSSAEPPQTLRGEIMDSVIRASSQPPSLGERRRLFLGWWAAAAMVVLAFLIADPLRWSRQSGSEQVATMAPPSAPSWPEVARFESHQVKLIIRRGGAGQLLLEPQLSGGKATVTLIWPPAQMSLSGISGVADPSSGNSRVQFNDLHPSQRVGVVVRPNAGVRSADVRVLVDHFEKIRAAVPLERPTF